MVDLNYMRRCFLLAERGMNLVSPNPRVGAVIVVDGEGRAEMAGVAENRNIATCEDSGLNCACGLGGVADEGIAIADKLGNGIIGEGWHKQYGGAHAEVNAIDDVRLRYGSAADELLRRSTLYVNLEPCSHYGKTPPCADLIIKCNIPRVVISCLDPNPRVNSAGVEHLRAAGIEVVTGILEKEGKFLNRRFFTRIKLKRPYIILKWAQSVDEFIAPYMQPLQGGFHLTGNETQIENHRLRANEDAIMVGTNTLLMDNPQLNTRMFKFKDESNASGESDNGSGGKNPLRISFDLHNRLPNTLHFFDGSQPTLLFIQKGTSKNSEDVFCKKPLLSLNRNFINMKLLTLGNECKHSLLSLNRNFESSRATKQAAVFRSSHINIQKPILPQVMQELNERKINSLIVEGGAALLNSFIEEGLYDEVHIYTAPVRLGSGLKAPALPSDVTMIEEKTSGQDKIWIALRRS